MDGKNCSYKYSSVSWPRSSSARVVSGSWMAKVQVHCARHPSQDLHKTSLTALLPGRLRRVELCRGANIIKTAVQNDFLLKGSATMNKEFSASLWQFFCLLSSILLSDLVVPRPPGKSVWISNVFVDRNTTDNIRYANQSAQARERSQKLPGCHFAPHGLPAGSTPRCP